MKKFFTTIIILSIAFYSYSLSEAEFKEIINETANRIEKVTRVLEKIQTDNDVATYIEQIKSLINEFKVFINKHKSNEQEINSRFDKLFRNDPLYIRAMKIANMFEKEYARVKKIPKGKLIIEILDTIDSGSCESSNQGGNPPQRPRD